MNAGRINFAYVTSCREIALDEQVGRIVVDPDSSECYGYREGNLENLARRLHNGDSAYDRDFASQFNLCAVIADDDDEQHRRAWETDIWPRELHVPAQNSDRHVEHKALEDLTIRIPSQPWKNIRPRREKAQAKEAYELEMWSYLVERDVDLIISDSYVTIFGPVMMDAYRGRILNIHPAITDVNDLNRLPGLTPTRDAFTRARYGWVIVDDKHAVDRPKGEEIDVEYQGQRRRAVKVARSNVTGVTVHVSTDAVDNGPVVLCEQYSFDPATTTPEKIRDTNYRIKRRLLPRAMLAYASRPDVQEKILRERKNKGYFQWVSNNGFRSARNA